MRSLLQKLAKLFVLGCLLTLGLVATDASAHITQLLDVTVSDLPDTGPIGEITVQLDIGTPLKDKQLRVVVVPNVREAPKVLTRLNEGQRSASITVSPGARTRTQVQFTLTDAPKQTVTILLIVADSNNVVIGSHRVALYFRVANGRYTRTNYQTLYLPPRLSVRSGERFVGRLEQVARGRLQIAPHKNRRAVFGRDALKKRPLPVREGTTKSARLDAPRKLNALQARALPLKPRAETAYNIKGRLLYNGVDGEWRGGWYWYMRLSYQKQDGTRVRLANGYINEDGIFSFTVGGSGYAGQNLIVEVRAGSDYVRPSDQQNSNYWWYWDIWEAIPREFDLGDLTVDLTENGGILAGLGDLYWHAHDFMYIFANNGVDPYRAQPIRVYYPNTWYNCEGNALWSCASVDGIIWLIAEHADSFTIRHELGHQLNYQRWNNELPPGVGGPHTATDCTTKGSALIEGFANAAAIWTTSSADAAETGPIELESPDPAVVCQGDTNETWVAATFWDLLDRPPDGKDTFYFNNPASAFEVYLSTKMRGRMGRYRNFYRNNVTPGHEQLVDDIFTQNTIPF